MPQYITLYKEEMFAKNIAVCRNSIFNLRYTDIKAMTGINQTTMSSYDTFPITSPFITNAHNIAEMYCTTIDRLCSSRIDFDIRETVKMQERFINRVRLFDVDEYKKRIHSRIEEANHVSEYDVYAMLTEIFNEIIYGLCKKQAYHVVYTGSSYGAYFTKTYNTLMYETETTTRTLAKACSLAKGTMTRLKQGYEPSLATAIKIADFFDMEVGDFLQLELPPKLLEKAKTAAQKEQISNKMAPIPYGRYEEVMNLQNNYINNEMAIRIADRELWCISIKKEQDPDKAFKDLF